MFSMLTITWDVSKGIDLGFFTLRYYSLLFALGFVLGYLLMKRIFKKEGIPQEKLDTLLTYMVIATIIGARLGHVLFYQWDYYSHHLLEILEVWEGGLASHGAVIGIIIAIIIYCRKVLKRPTLWMLDRLVITIALAGALIRLGNFFNSEIYGDPHNSRFQTVYPDPTREAVLNSFGNVIDVVDFKLLPEQEVTDTLIYPVYDMQFRVLPNIEHQVADNVISTRIKPFVNSFTKENTNIIFTEKSKVAWDEEKPDLAHVQVLGVPRTPTEIYESIGYFLIFLILYRIFINEKLANRQGFIFGMFLILIFGFRFAIEFLKENQVTAEEGNVLNIGQWLSIPCVLAGLYFVVTSRYKKPVRDEQKD